MDDICSEKFARGETAAKTTPSPPRCIFEGNWRSALIRALNGRSVDALNPGVSGMFRCSGLRGRALEALNPDLLTQ